MVKIIYTKVSADVCKHNRKFYQSHVRKAFIKWCAYQGYFDEVFTKQEIKQAKKGQLPKDCNIHHKIPLSGSNDLMVNDFCNLTVLHKKKLTFRKVKQPADITQEFSGPLKFLTQAVVCGPPKLVSPLLC